MPPPVLLSIPTLPRPTEFILEPLEPHSEYPGREQLQIHHSLIAPTANLKVENGALVP
jgi:hypothetical protein